MISAGEGQDAPSDASSKPYVDPTGDDAHEVMQAKPDKVTMQGTAGHVERLESGWSPKAPDGVTGPVAGRAATRAAKSYKPR